MPLGKVGVGAKGAAGSKEIESVKVRIRSRAAAATNKPHRSPCAELDTFAPTLPQSLS